MRRLLLITLSTLAWLLASPSLQLPDAGWIEVGPLPAAAQDLQAVREPAKVSEKKSAKKKSRPARIGSSGIVPSNQPGMHPMRPIDPPQNPNVTGSVSRAPDVRGYPDVPTVPLVPRGATTGAGLETSQDRVARCTHQGALGGLSGGQQGGYVHNCAF